MVVQGVRVVLTGAAAALILEDVSQELCAYMCQHIAGFCYGAKEAAEDAAYYSLEKTIRELLERLDAKDRNTRVGMVGEFAIHVLLGEAHADLTSAALYLNKEDKAVKKGFDGTFHEESVSRLWYGEVKSGEPNLQQTVAEKTSALLRARCQ
jgi:hypothetical protein